MMPKTTCNCTDCRKDFPQSKMAKGRRICKRCYAAREAERKEAARKPLAIETLPEHESLPAGSLTDRDALNVTVKGNMEAALADANALIVRCKARLAAAEASGDARSVNEAGKSLQQALGQHVQLISKLMDKLQAVEDLRAQSEKAKPVQFFLMEPPAPAVVLPLRKQDHDKGFPPLPAELYDADGNLIVGGRVLPSTSYAVKLVASRCVPDSLYPVADDETSTGKSARVLEWESYYTSWTGNFIAEATNAQR